MEIVFELEKIPVDALIYPLIADLPRIIKLYPLNNIPHGFMTKEYSIKISRCIVGDNYSIGVRLLHFKRWEAVYNDDYSDALIRSLNDIERRYQSNMMVTNSPNRKYPLYQLLENVYITLGVKTFDWKGYTLVFIKSNDIRFLILRNDEIIYRSIGTDMRTLVKELLADMDAGRTGLLELPIERIKSARK
jgi:hypothetical protein